MPYLGQHLQRHVPVELRIPRLLHLTHAAFADLGGDAVGAEGGAGFERHGSVHRHPRFEFLEPILDDGDLSC